MAALSGAPFKAQEVFQVAYLIKDLEACTSTQGSSKSHARSKKTSFEISGTGLVVDSWRFQEWDYKRRDLPTYARGLFTYCRYDRTPEIAVRGYDKFFNVGEVHETNWDNIREMTTGPYELSVKENGCIIFISGVEGDHLLVCSKHSTGARQDTALSHAMAGEHWVEQHLKKVGRTTTELARELRGRNVTAVAELCDDTFEEHVLAYKQKDAGLYLHGVNLNLPEFVTYPADLVDQFADTWGFRKAQHLVKNDVESMQSFLEGCAESGSFDGRDTEGFVIRCRRRNEPNGVDYHNWFFKFKFEEPYLMYRQWREATKAAISGKAPKYKKHVKITDEYLIYARQQFAKDASLAKAYQMNHGIIALRERFLHERGLKGSDIIRAEQEVDEKSSMQVSNNVVLLPIASIGCGKTTVAVALTKLFDWGHVQNDNITGKTNRPKQFTTQLCNTLASAPVTIGDRNNHQKRERKQIIGDMLQIIPDARFIALHYVHDPKPQMLPAIRKITQGRIFARGDNHQTIQAGSKSPQEIISIMEGFLARFEPLDSSSEPDDGFDEIIDLDVAASSRENLEVVVSAIHEKYPQIIPAMPTADEFDGAIEAAMNDYKPDLKHDLSFASKKKDKGPKADGVSSPPNGHGAQAPKPPKLEYFCIRLPTVEMISILDRAFNSQSSEKAKMYRQLQQSRRIQSAFHVTLMHRTSIPSHPELWSRLAALHSAAVVQSASAKPNTPPTFDPLLGTCRVRLERIVWDEGVMCVIARLLDDGWESANEIPHVTIGTASQDIKPKESNTLLQRWIQEGDHQGPIMELDLGAHVEVSGSVRAVTHSTR